MRFTGMSADTTYRLFSVMMMYALSSLRRMIDSIGEVYSVSDLTRHFDSPDTPMQQVLDRLSLK
jgi:hypothetical protein